MISLDQVQCFPGGSDCKECACNAGDQGLIPGSGRSPGEENGNPLQLFLPGESHGQRRLVGYSLWSHKESDMTERLTYTHTHTHTLGQVQPLVITRYRIYIMFLVAISSRKIITSV